MSRRAKESDASLAFSTTMIDDEFFWIFSSCCVFLDLFFVRFGSLFVFCVHDSIIYSVSSEAVFSYFTENILSQKKTKKKKREEHKRPTKCSRLPFVFFY